jgi:hypothetical protein
MATQKTAFPQDGIESFIGKRELKSVDVTTGLATFRIRPSSGKGPDGPEFSLPLSSVLPGTDDDTIEFWKSLVDSLMATLKDQGRFPTFIRGYEVHVDDDSSGDPAIYVRILVPRQETYKALTVSQWNQFASLLQRSLTGLRIQRYPYIQIGEKRGSR